MKTVTYSLLNAVSLAAGLALTPLVGAVTLECSVINEGYINGQPQWLPTKPIHLEPTVASSKVLFESPALSIQITPGPIVQAENAVSELMNYQLVVTQADQRLTVRSAPLSAGGELQMSLQHQAAELTISCAPMP